MLFGKKKEKSQETENTVDNSRTLSSGSLEVKDIIAPSAIEVDFDHIKIGPKFFRTLFVSGYPRFVGANWLEPIINFDHSLLLSMFYYPIEARGVLDDLRRKIAEMEATLATDRERGRVVDPAVQAALDDAGSLQEQLVKGMERFFQFSFYITITADTYEELVNISTRVESALGSLMLISKHATLQMEEAFQSTIPVCLDKLFITRNMDTTSVATTFPFTSSELSANDGILYGINKHNGSLIIFDRFSLENANSVIFAKSGSGKSYLVKIEVLRSLLFGCDIIVIDPENEYKKLCEALNGDYIDFSINSTARINPFDLPESVTGSEESKDVLGLKILTLHTLFKIMLGNLNPTEEAVLDNALVTTYKLKGITQDPATQVKEPPVMQDLYKVLLAMEEPEAKGLSERLERYIKGSLSGIFDQRSTVRIKNAATVFSVQNLEDILRPIAIYIILDFVWTKIKGELKRRIMVVDEAWYLMQNPDSAEFLYSIAKRARKYYLGLTTITQDVSDFLDSQYGKAIITNSSMQVLLRQHPAAIDQIADIFYLSEGEKRLLLSAGVGEGIFFAGSNHVAMQVIASEYEHKLITTNPAEIIKMREGEEETKIEKLKKKFAEIKLKSEPALPHTDNQDSSVIQKAPEIKAPETTLLTPPPDPKEPSKNPPEILR